MTRRLAADTIPVCRERALAAAIPERQAIFDGCMKAAGF